MKKILFFFVFILSSSISNDIFSEEVEKTNFRIVKIILTEQGIGIDLNKVVHHTDGSQEKSVVQFTFEKNDPSVQVLLSPACNNIYSRADHPISELEIESKGNSNLYIIKKLICIPRGF